jgi:3-oxoacyl-[acyl-carrier protein] reductase
MSASNRVAIVTGGSRGIGRAIALRLAQDGLRVAVNYAGHAEAANEVVKQIQQAGSKAIAVQADIGNTEAARALVQAANDAFGQVDVLVNNAGVAVTGMRIGDTSEQDWQRILNVNLNGPFYMCQAVLPLMRARKQGQIVNISSNVTLRLPAMMGAYTVSKMALNAMTTVMAKEEGVHGIRINAIAPGPIMTDMLAESLRIMGKERADAFLKSVPMGRAGQPEEIAGMVAMLVSDTASYVTGQVIYVNGGGPGG